MKKYHSIKIKAREFGKGTIKGLASLVFTPTIYRIDKKFYLNNNKYEVLGFTSAFYGTLISGIALASKIDEEKQLLIFSTIMATNTISFIYESIRNKIKHNFIKYKKHV